MIWYLIMQKETLLKYRLPMLLRNGLTWLCNHLGFGINKAIDVGDAENDMDAIATAGLGVAMANAIDKVKEIADVVLENDCDHSGCAEAIEKYLLG